MPGDTLCVMEGKFPKWRDVIPTDYPLVCKVDADDLAALMTSALGATSEESRGADITCADDVLTVSTQSEENGRYSSGIVVTSHENPLDLTLDCRYVLDWAKACNGHVLHISAFDVDLEKPKDKQADHGVLIQCEGADYVVMPLARDRK